MLAVCAEQNVTTWSSVLMEFALVRIAPKQGATRGDVTRDLGPYFAHKLSPSEFRQELDNVLGHLEAGCLVAQKRGRFHLTGSADVVVGRRLGIIALPDEWSELRDQHLTALALRRPDLPQTRKKLLAKPDGLRMAIVQRAFDIKLRRVPTPARIRAALAGVALKRVMEGKLQTDLRAEGGVDAATGRALAAQLARRPREFNSDAQLLAALAAEAIGAAQGDISTLRLVLFRQYISDHGDGQSHPSNLAEADAGTCGPDAGGVACRPDTTDLADALSPDDEIASKLENFADAVHAAAEYCAVGWQGNRKAFISQVLETLRQQQSGATWSDDDFKALLIEAHRTGHVTLATADLKSKDDLEDFERSATTYKNTTWHFVRLDT